MIISEKIKSQILKTVRRYLEFRTGLKEDLEEFPDDSFYNEEYGLFVTLNKNGALRGCIGYIEGVRPLREALFDLAESAAFRDFRFPPVKAQEVEEIRIEISILSPLSDIGHFSEIELGYHGVVLHHGQEQAVFLPQVAREQDWDLETMLSYLSVKAGCGENAYLDRKTRFEVFSAEVFREKP